MRFNGKQIAFMVACFVVAFIINWLLWLVIMRHPENIGIVYQLLVTLCLGSAFIVVGDGVFKLGIYK